MSLGIRHFYQWISRLLGQPVFWFVTLFGHCSILLSAALFRNFETDLNGNVYSWFDCFYWAIATATTVGSAIVPYTYAGKWVAIGLMVSGSLFLWSYAALFAASVVLPSVQEFDRDVKALDKEIRAMDRDLRSGLRDRRNTSSAKSGFGKHELDDECDD